MKVVQLNSACHGSTGMLMEILSQAMTEKGIENRMLYTFGKDPAENGFRYSSDAEIKLNALCSRITGRYGFVSERPTQHLIQFLKEYQPDLVQIHTIHGHDLNLTEFFRYLKDTEVPVVYTFHDCWQFTGYCPYYTWARCEKWKTGCGNCPLAKRYSWFLDRSAENYRKKQEALSGFRALQIVTPSRWMKQQVGESFLREVPCTVIPNGIDLNVFFPSESNVRNQLHLNNQKIVLGIALSLSEAKGFHDYLELSRRLPDNHVLVLVGVPEKKRNDLPADIIALPRTSSREELRDLYSAADVTVVPTHEDNFPTVILESLACGTPVVTYQVGGAPEALDEKTGRAVAENDLAALTEAAAELSEKKKEYTAFCRKKAEDRYSMKQFTDSYLSLYEQMVSCAYQQHGTAC